MGCPLCLRRSQEKSRRRAGERHTVQSLAEVAMGTSKEATLISPMNRDMGSATEDSESNDEVLGQSAFAV